MPRRYEYYDITSQVERYRRRNNLPSRVDLAGKSYRVYSPLKVVIFSQKEELANFVVDSLRRTFSDYPSEGIIMPTGNTFIPIYERAKERKKELVQGARQRRWANLDEYYPLNKRSPNFSLAYVVYSRERVIEPLGIPEENWIIPDGTALNPYVEAERFEELLKKERWALAMLGIGPDEKRVQGRIIPASPHIGFIPPGTTPEQGAMYVHLDEGTIFANSQDAPDPYNFFTGAITQGPLDIRRASQHILVATGPYKKCNMRDALLGPPTLEKPATLLQLFPDVTFVLDREAAENILQQIA